MNKIFFLLSLLMLSLISYSQDKIVTHHGDTIKCYIIDSADSSIEFNYIGDDSSNDISQYLVKELIFEDGTVREVSDKVIINGVDDWEKVQITIEAADVEGLVCFGEVKSSSNSIWSTTANSLMDKKAMDRLKRQAARNGCHIILIMKTTDWDGRNDDGSNASVKGIAYKY